MGQMTSEQTIQQHIRLACSKGNCRLFRNNTGTLRDQHGRLGGWDEQRATWVDMREAK